MSLFAQQHKRRAALVERLGTVADLACKTPLVGELGDIAYDLLRQAAAQIASDKQQMVERESVLVNLRGHAHDVIEQNNRNKVAVDLARLILAATDKGSIR